jgi:branched-chain amino acid transport system permease protein
MLRFRLTPIFGFAALIVLMPVLAAGIPAVEHYPDIMIFAGIYSLIVIGLSLLMGYAGQISLGQAAFFGIGAYFSGVLTTSYGFNPWLCMLLGAVAAGVVAVLVGGPSLKLRGYYLAMATLAFGIIVNIVFREESQWTGGPDGLSGIPGLSIFGFEFNTVGRYYFLVWAVVLLAFVFTMNLIQSPLGRSLRAIHVSEPAAAAVGINIARSKVLVFVYSAVLAALAGSLYAHYMNFINAATFDLFFSIKLVIMIALGGMYTIWGALIGAILVAFLSLEWLHYFEELEIVIYGLILLLVTIFLPEGLAGLPDRLRTWFKEKAS